MCKCYCCLFQTSHYSYYLKLQVLEIQTAIQIFLHVHISGKRARQFATYLCYWMLNFSLTSVSAFGVPTQGAPEAG